MDEKPTDTQTTLRIPEELLKEVKHLCIDRETTFNELVVNLLRKEVKTVSPTPRKSQKAAA